MIQLFQACYFRRLAETISYLYKSIFRKESKVLGLQNHPIPISELHKVRSHASRPSMNFLLLSNGKSVTTSKDS